MNAPSIVPLVAVDVGNSRVKLGLFDSVAGTPLPQPISTLDIGPRPEDLDRIRDWLPAKDITSLSGGSAACSATWPAGWWRG